MYLGHIITNGLTDDEDICSEIINMFVHINILIHKFSKCSSAVNPYTAGAEHFRFSAGYRNQLCSVTVVCRQALTAGAAYSRFHQQTHWCHPLVNGMLAIGLWPGWARQQVTSARCSHDVAQLLQPSPRGTKPTFAIL